MQKFILCLTLLMVVMSTSRANAASPADYDSVTLITHAEFKMMSSESQDRYVTGLRAIFNDWASQQKEQKMKYQSVEVSRPKAFAMLEAFFADAQAADVDERPCAYAGYVSEMDVNGRHCMSREKCGGNTPARRGWVKCNPLVYGAGVCAPPGNGGTAYCASHAKSNAEIRQYILSHGEEFMALRSQLRDVCGTVKNPTVCQSIQFRVTQMYEQVKGDLPRGTTPDQTSGRAGDGATTQRPTAGRPSGGQGGGTFSEAAPPVPPSGRASSSSSASGSAVDVPQSNAPAAQPSRTRESSDAEIVVTGNRSTGPTGKCEKFAPRCEPSALMQPMIGPQDDSWAGKTLMTLREAQDLYCSTDAINPAFIESVKRFVRQQQARTRSMKPRDRNYYSCHYHQMEQNFDACVATAQANRAANRVPNDGGPLSVVLTQRGDVIDMQVTGADVTYNTTTVEPYLGLMLGLRYRMADQRFPDGRVVRIVKTASDSEQAPGYEIDLCKVRMVGAPQGNGSVQPNPPAGAPSSGGSGGQ